MKNQGQKKVFELSTLKADNLVELSGFEKSQNQLVKDNPFIKITDNKTFEVAKKRRTALKTGRTTIQGQDKVIASFLNSFRKGTKAITEKLIGITKSAEEKQQIEIDLFQEKLNEEKRKKEQAEEIRVQAIKENIDVTVELLKTLIAEMTLENYESNREKFNITIENTKDQDFEIFQFMLDEGIEIQKQSMLDKINQINTDESNRLELLWKDQQSKIDSLFREATEMIDNATIEMIEKLDHNVGNLLDVGFDFGKYQQDFSDMVEKIHTKVDFKIKTLKEQKLRDQDNEIQIQRNSVINLREGLLDIIFQMNVENFKEGKEKVEKALSQPTVPVKLAQDEFNKMVERVNESLVQRLEMIDVKLIALNKEKEAESKRINDVFKIRKAQLSKLGLKFGSGIVQGFGISSCENVFKNTTDDEFSEQIEMIVVQIKEFKLNDKKEKARQKRLNSERETLIDFIDNGIRKTTLSATLKQPEMIETKKHIEAELNAFCDSLIENVKSK